MKNDNLFDAFGEIDDKFIEQAEKSEPSKERRRGLCFFRSGIFAACMALVIVSVTTALYVASNKIPYETELPYPSSESADTYETEEVIKNNGDFIIRNGTLVRYIGKSSIIVIPDHVKTISAGAFLNTPEIKYIKIGKNVNEIDSLALQTLASVQKVTVDRRNKHFKTSNGFLFVKTDKGMTAIISLQNQDDKVNGIEVACARISYMRYQDN